MPSRWPRQQVRNVLSARTPRSSGRPTRLRECAGGGVLRIGHGRGALRQRPLAVDRLAHGVENPSQPQRRRPHLVAGIADHGAAAAPHPFETGKRHHHGIVAGEADDLAGDEAVAAGIDHDPRPHAHGVDGTGDLHHQAANADDTAIDVDAVDIADLFGKRLHCENLKFSRLRAVPLTWCLLASLIITSLSLVTEAARPVEGRASLESRLNPPLNVELERDRVRKAASTQYLRAIRKKLHLSILRTGIRFC